VLDLYSRRIVGWAMQPHLTSELASEALRMALRHRQPPKNLIHHSDRGSQYASHAYQGLIKHHAIAPSMSGTGNCYDNAPRESFFATLKLELVHRRTYATRAEAKLDIFEYIEVFYNRIRRHSALRYLSPVNFEMAPVVP
jgi:transposase InsO family protein